jgi:WD40 repeat protein
MKAHKSAQLFLCLVFFGVVLSSNSGAQTVNESELRYREALRKQQVDGDLPAAIKLYQDLVASKTADKATKAKALLQLGMCYDALGRESQSVYQQILRDFPEQAAAAQAKAKLAALRQTVAPSTITLRKVDFAPGIQNVVATDGQRAMYWDADYTTLLYSDVDGKNRKVVFTTTADRRPVPYPSRDLSMVILYFTQSQQSPDSYAVVKTDGTGYRELDLTLGGNKLPVTRPQNLTWSRDNRYLLLSLGTQDRKRHLFRVSVADGKTVDLLPRRQGSVTFAISSPEDRYIAFEEETGAIYVMPASGGEPQLIAPDAELADWTDDGKYLFFGADSNKTFSFFAVPMKDGRGAGERIYIRPVERQFRPLSYGTSVVYGQLPPKGAFQKVFVASFDAKSVFSGWKEMNVIGPGGFYPTWSPDGSQFAYIAHTIGERASAVRIHTVITNEDRELFRSDDPIMNCVWASQHPTLYCGQLTTAGKTDALQISTDTGRAENLRTFQGTRVMRQLSADDRILYMGNLGAGTGWPKWEIGTDNETPGPNTVSTSPDGQWTFRNTTDLQNRREFQIRPTSGTEADWRHVAYLKRQAAVGGLPIPVRYTPDSNWLLYHDKDADGKDALFRVPTSGGESQRIGTYPTSAVNSQIEISLEGQHILLMVPIEPQSTPQPEFWVGQNLIPATAKAATKAPAK